MIRIYDWEWRQIGNRFTEEEKATLNHSIAEPIIASVGSVLDEKKMGQRLTDKVKAALVETFK